MMITKPNEQSTNIYGDENKRKNQIGRKFSEIFEIFTNPNYYEGTRYAEFFNEINDDGTSKIYVVDPLEAQLDSFVNSRKNELKYLVGLTGMGKTTLIRNYFKISNRDIVIKDNTILVYISFYYADLLSDCPQKSVTDEIVKYFTRTIKRLLLENSDLINNEKAFWEGFYCFIQSNKPTMLENEELSPSTTSFGELLRDDSYNSKIKKLDSACSADPLEYYTSMIKYILRSTEKTYKVILIYDDIESKDEKFHRPVVEIARHLHSCFSAIESTKIKIKTLVSLRAYTFRCNIGRQSEARREYLKNDVILKERTVSIHDIFEKRFDAIESNLRIKENIGNLKEYDAAKEQLRYVETQLAKIGSDLIYNIANYNLSDALIVYSNVLTNLEWIPCGEREFNGAFTIDAKNYRITTDNIMYAIANGNSVKYLGGDGYIPNILYNDKDGITLISLYIIKYLITRKYDNIYGQKYIIGKELQQEIKELFVSKADSKVRDQYWEYRINDAITHLYNTGILFRSLYDIEDADGQQIERKYNEKYKIYLSPRGKCLFGMLSKNAVLLELYRDDIYVDLPNNDKLTSQLDTVTIFDYLLDYIDVCFETEKRNISDAIPRLDKYYEVIGNEYISSVLLEGVVRNLRAYFKNEDDSYDELNKKAMKICSDMLDYSTSIEDRHGIIFEISTYLLEYLNENKK